MAPALGRNLMGFDTRRVLVQTPLGGTFTKTIHCGMPKIPQETLGTAFYLYESREDAEKGERFGGTGFLVGIPSQVKPDSHYLYAVSNWHVACRDGMSVIRVNTHAGGVDIFELDPSDWHQHPNRADIAVAPVILTDVHKYFFIPTVLFCDERLKAAHMIGPGDDVMMIGRFIDHDGGPTNKPAVRFGNISIDPSPIEQPSGAMALSYCVDARSRTGFSGSPVFVFRTAASDLTSPNGTTRIGSNLQLLLGIHWGQFGEEWELKEEANKAAESKPLTVKQKRDKKFVQGLSGMTLVLPASLILEALNQPSLAGPRQISEWKYMEGKGVFNVPMPETTSLPSSVSVSPTQQAATPPSDVSSLEPFELTLPKEVRS